jgi:large subunit ribosomal protein L18
MGKKSIKYARRERRSKGVRKRLFGTPERPRLSVHRTLKHIYAQIIDDVSGRTLASVSSLQPGLREQLPNAGNRQAAEAVGARLAEVSIEKGIGKVCFDRGPFKYHGRVKALADAARKGGLQF